MFSFEPRRTSFSDGPRTTRSHRITSAVARPQPVQGVRLRSRSPHASKNAARLESLLPVLQQSGQIKSPNSGSRTPRNSRKTNNADQLKSPKNQILQNQKLEHSPSVRRGFHCISNRF